MGKLISYNEICPAGLQEPIAYPHIIMSNADMDSMQFFYDYVQYSNDDNLTREDRTAISEFVYVSLATRIN